MTDSQRPDRKTPVSADLKIAARELRARTKVTQVTVPYVHPRDVVDIVKNRLAARKAQKLEHQLSTPNREG